jgi:hypothetical protein
MQRRRRHLLTILSILALYLVVWELLYHGPAEPKDLRYMGWKLGIYPMDPGDALETMVGDTYPDKLVVGKTEAELRKKFGFVTPLERASEYVKYCYNNSDRRGQEVFMLRNSNWMVVIKNGRAQELVLVKGC